MSRKNIVCLMMINVMEKKSRPSSEGCCILRVETDG